MDRVKITYRGWCGHPRELVGLDNYAFWLNTLVECGERSYVVSTVGHRYHQTRDVQDPVNALGWYYQTLVWPAVFNGAVWEAPNEKPVIAAGTSKRFPAGQTVAQEMHDRIVRRVAGQLKSKAEVKP